jgi:hypothetical protein
MSDRELRHHFNGLRELVHGFGCMILGPLATNDGWPTIGAVLFCAGMGMLLMSCVSDWQAGRAREESPR